MKRYIVLLLLATQILPAYSSNSLQYPDDCCIYDTKNNYAVMLSSLYNNFVAYYGLADNRELIHFDIQGREQIWSYRYNIGLQIYVYNFYNSMFKIQVSSPQFRTSRGIMVGDLEEKVLQEYGEPDLISKEPDGSKVYEYHYHVPELNGKKTSSKKTNKYTVLSFVIDKKQLVNSIVMENKG